MSDITEIECVCKAYEHNREHHSLCPVAVNRRETLARFGLCVDGFYECGLAKAYVTANKSLDTLQANGDQLSRAVSAAHTWARGEGTLFVLCHSGETGTGKTHLASAAVAQAIRNGSYGRYTTLSRMVTELTDAPIGEKINTLNKFARVKYLAIDELGGERPTAYTVSKLSEVINERYQHEKRTFLTSNMSLQELGNRWAPADEAIAAKRVVDRIYEATGGKTGAGDFKLDDAKPWRVQ